VKHPYLTTRADSTHYYFRRKVPLKLRPLLDRTEIWLSLETPCRTEAISRLPIAALEFERLVAPARATATGENWLPHGLRPASEDEPHPYHPTVCPTAWTPLADIHIPRLLERYRAHALASERAYRVALLAKDVPGAEGAPDEEARAAARERLAEEGYDAAAHLDLLRQEMEQLQDAHVAENYADLREQVEELLTFERVWLPAASDGFARLLVEFATTRLDVLEEELRRYAAKGQPDPALAPLVDEHDTWAAAVPTWVAEAAPQPKTADEVRTQVARFERLVGSLPLSALTAAHVEQFKVACIEQEKVSKSRVNTIVSLLSAVINVAIKKKLTTLVANPFAGAKYSRKAVRQDADPEAQRDAYTVDELNRLYASRVYVHGHRPGKGGREAAYWVPLLGLYTGARLEDLCRLRARDAVQRAGVWCLHLHDTKREHRTGEENIMRHVPVHRTLLRLGWLDYVQAQDAGGLLFPHLKPNKYGQLSAMWSTWFAEYLDADVGLPDRRLDFHSFRHTFKAFGQLSGIEGPVIEELLGHAPDEWYGRNEGTEKRLPFELLVQAMEKLDFPGLQLSHLPCAGPA
jgi:integrase